MLKQVHDIFHHFPYYDAASRRGRVRRGVEEMKMRGETLKVLLVVLLVCSIALLAGITASGPVPPGSAVTTTHGLRGHYYTRSLPGSYDLKGFLVDAYNIPTGNEEPDAIRIDPQLAFGRGKGFDLDSEHDFRNTK